MHVEWVYKENFLLDNLPISTIYMTCQVKHNSSQKNVNDDDDSIEVVEVKRSLGSVLEVLSGRGVLEEFLKCSK